MERDGDEGEAEWRLGDPTGGATWNDLPVCADIGAVGDKDLVVTRAPDPTAVCRLPVVRTATGPAPAQTSETGKTQGCTLEDRRARMGWSVALATPSWLVLSSEERAPETSRPIRNAVKVAGRGASALTGRLLGPTGLRCCA